jgi:DNA processing protein
MACGDEWRAWLALKMVRGIGNVLGINLIRAFGSPGAAFVASTHALECAGVRRDAARAIRGFDRWAAVDAQIARLTACGVRLVTWLDESYPESLRQIYDPPLFLFAKGELGRSDDLAVAIVGTRVPSAYGRQMARGLTEGLARSGLTIVSGLARGIDAEAHATALRVGGRTIAVLGSGIDVVYPSEHHQLLMQVSQQGCVVSELPMGAAPDAENFPGRNRIISGLSLGVVVIEAAERSGSLITAQYALDQGRDVFAVPGPVGERTRGTHQLLRQGATLTESAEDVITEIAPHLVRKKPPTVTPVVDGDDARVYRTVEDTATDIEAIITATGLPAATTLDILMRLELRGLITQLPGKCFARKASPRATH